MPFRRESMRELREQLDMSREEFTFAVNEVAERLGSKINYSVSTIRNYEVGNTIPLVDFLDCLYAIAKYRGCKDIVFYEPPSVKKRHR